MDTKNQQNNFNNPVVVILLIALLGLGGYFIFTKNSTQPSNSPAENIQDTKTPVVTQEKSPVVQKKSGDSSTFVDYRINPPLITNMYTENGNEQGFKLISLGGNSVTEDGNVFSVTLTDLGQSIPTFKIGQGNTTRTTNGKFIKVDVTINNTGSSREGIWLTPVALYDDAGRFYNFEEDMRDTDAYNKTFSGNCGSTLHQLILDADIPCTIHQIAEVGQSSKSYTAKFYYKREW